MAKLSSKRLAPGSVFVDPPPSGRHVDVLLDAPMVPEPKRRHRHVIETGHSHAHPKSVRWEAKLAELASDAFPPGIIDEPCIVDVLAVFPRPARLLKACYTDGLIWCGNLADRDNVDKAVLDAFKPFWRDDNRVSLGAILKCYAERDGRSRVVVRVRTALPPPEDVARRLGLMR